MPSLTRKPEETIRIRPVYAYNLKFEFSLISACLRHSPFATLDTEFPGVIHQPRQHQNVAHMSPTERYTVLKSNVNSLNLIQLGLSLSDSAGNVTAVWEFNFSDFDIRRDRHNRESIKLLKSNGIDFEKNVQMGIKTRDFAILMMNSGLLFNNKMRWVCFHGAYDFGYMIKILTGRNLPKNLWNFIGLVRFYFGEFLDLKYAMRFMDGMYGGLERVAGTLGVERVSGRSHQAGSDSLLTWQVYWRMKEVVVGDGVMERKHGGVLFGLEV